MIDTFIDPEAQKSITDIVEQIIADYQPEKIILFGSYAYGQPRPDSDIDLLIVKTTSERPIDRRLTVRRMVYSPQRRIPFSPLVLTPSEIDERLESGDDFLEEIFQRGKKLYG
jgi:predicted nucleotidyltransferase